MEYGGISEKNISVIYNGIAPCWFETICAEYRQCVLDKFQLPNNFLLFTGTLQHKKNLPRLIDAYLQLPDDIQHAYPLVVVGRAGWGMDASLAAIDQLVTKKRGVWLDYVTHDELRTLFQCATIYLYPSLHEGFGLTLLEAFASQTPVITANVAALPEIAQDAAYLIDPYSMTEMKAAIEMLLTSTTQRDMLIQKGRERVNAFSWEKCAKQTLQVYQQVLSQS
jgi:alpha-1,3-rhamnosyl/mannosyltransferase